MTSTPAISVVLTVYNTERYVAEAVESILNQTFDDFEFIIIDDGSTDSSLKILQDFARRDGRIRLVSRANTGIPRALNEGLRMAKAPLIARMDADDVCMPERFALQVEFLEQHPEIDVVGARGVVIDAAGRELIDIFVPATNEQIEEKLLSGVCPILHPCAMIRREAINAVGGYDETMTAAQDLDLWLRLSEHGKLANLPQILVKYRQHDQSVSESKSAIQHECTRRAVEAAYRRRGLNRTYKPVAPFRPGTDRRSRHQWSMMYGWWAFKRGDRATMLHYALETVRYMPWRLGGWRLLACGLLKRMPSPTRFDMLKTNGR